MKKTIACLALGLLLGGCVTAHRPTPGWQCRADPSGALADAYANVAADGTLLETSWYWTWRDYDQGLAIHAYAGDGTYRRGDPVPLDGNTTALITVSGEIGSGSVVLSHERDAAAFASPIATGLPGENGTRIDMARLVELARSDAPIYAARRDKGGTITSRTLPKDEIVDGAALLADVLADLRAKVAAPAASCIAVDDLYPEIIVT